ncbi:tyrosine phosphatase [Cordyceps militaris]|uniref:Tyrosine phosphatase n=1 Tax=Cordyceps militaris TaxID=73501 RepID=A0A2H4SS88_CORMI|nr:tyrosine phosphatase [Cordyceps militaris]
MNLSLKLRGQCLGSTKMVEVDKFASENKYLQHSNKNKGNPWIFQMPFFPKIDDGHRGTAELVWGGNMTVSDWKPTGVQGEKEPAASEQVCFSEGGSSKCNEGGDKTKYE